MSRADGAAVPRWFELAVLSAVAFVSGLALTALLLAVMGMYRPIVALAIGANVGLVCVLGVVRLPPRETGLERRRPAIAAVAVTFVVVAAMTAMNGWSHSEHVLSSRDPGVYLITGKWLAEQGELPIAAAVGPFADDETVDPASSLGFFPEGYPDDPSRTGELQPQFVHLYPALLGTVNGLVGDQAAQIVPAVLGGLALLALFVLGSRWMPVWAAAGATIAVAVSLPQAFFSRDAFSEVPVQVFLCGGIALAAWAFAGPRDHMWPAFVAGLVLGTAVAARVDALVALVVLPLWMSARWIEQPRRSRQRVIAMAAGAAIAIALATVDLLVRSRPYFDLHRSEVLSQAVVFGASVLLAVLAAIVVPRWRGLRSFVRRWRRVVAALAAVGTVGLAAFAWFIRPQIETTTEIPSGAIEFLQNAEGLVIDPARRYYEHSMEWLSWYVGPVALAVGILGIALAVRWVMLGKSARTGLALAVGAFLAPTVLYLWRARAFPDHLWVMRRFLPLTLPGIALACFAVLGMMWRTRDALLRIAALVVAGFAVAAPAIALQPVWRASTDRGVQDAVDAMCDTVGVDGAVVVLPGDAALDKLLPQTIRSWCGVPAAGGLPIFDAAAARVLDARWADQGRRLFVIGDDPDTVGAVTAADQQTILVPTDRKLEETLTRRPSNLIEHTYRFVIAPVGTAG